MRFRRQLSTVLFAWVSSLMLGAGEIAHCQTASSTDLRERLRTLEVYGSDTTDLSFLFQNGDKYLSDIVPLLDDSDAKVRANAERMIRYLANPDGMDAIFYSYSKREDVNIVGPIPIPLSDWDYDYVDATFVDKPGNFGFASLRYLYALFLDDSPKAKKLLSKIVKTAKRSGTDPFVIRAVTGKPLAAFSVHSDAELVAAVLKNSFFLSDKERRVSKAKLVSFDADKAKALIEIYVNFGPLAEEVYHVVVSKRSTGWNFVSISKVLET